MIHCAPENWLFTSAESAPLLALIINNKKKKRICKSFVFIFTGGEWKSVSVLILAPAAGSAALLFGPVVDLCPTGLSSPSVLHTWATAHWRAGRAPNPRIIITHRLPGGWVTFPAIRTHLPSANCGQDPYSVTVRKNKDTKLIFNICWYKSYVLNKKIKSNAPFGTFINYKSLKTLCACQFNPSKGYKITSIAHDQ